MFEVCRGVLLGDPPVLARLRAAGFACEAGNWAFRLPALHAWLAPPENYRDWRRALYAGDLNARLRALGGEVVIAEAASRIDETLYMLRWIA